MVKKALTLAIDNPGDEIAFGFRRTSNSLLLSRLQIDIMTQEEDHVRWQYRHI
jgi:hypothetical protein